MKELKYNFVFFGVGEDYVRARYECDDPSVRTYERFVGGSSLLKFLNRIHFSHSINSKVDLPLKRIWFKRISKQDFPVERPICYVFLGGNMIHYDGGLCDYLHRQNLENRLVVLHGDLIAKKIHWDYSKLRNKVDLCVTYDKDEAQKYGIKMFKSPVHTYKKLIVNQYTGQYDYDVYYLAAVKDRLEEIMETYHYLHDRGIKCKFVLVGVPEEKQGNYEGITYSKGISYKENLENVVRSKCILEIKQKGAADSITVRHVEASEYGRRILTTSHIDPKGIFNPGQCLIFDKPEEIDINFIKAEMPEGNYSCLMKSDPLSRCYAIQELLEEEREG